MDGSTQSPTETYTVGFHHRAIVASVFIGLAMIGSFGNALVIFSVVITKKLQTITNILVVNLAVADFVTCCCLPFQATGLLSRTGSYPLHESLCATVAGAINTCVCCSASNLVAIAFVRWYVITRSIRGHQGMHTPRKIAAVGLILWILSAAFIVISPLLGVGRFGYFQYYGMCVFIVTNRGAFYHLTLQGVVIAIILTLTMTFYGLVLRHVLRHNEKFRDKYAVEKDKPSSSTEANQAKNSSSVSPDSRPPMIKAINQKEIEITKNVFTVVCLFVICFVASSISFIIPGASLPTLYAYMIMMANSVVNPIIYGLKHPNFKEAFKRILCCRHEQL